MPKHSPLDPSLEPVKHLSTRLQRKLVKRVKKQRKHYRSSGKPYPLVMNRPGTEENRSGPAWASSLTAGQRVALAIASVVLLLTLGLIGIAAASHAANGVGLLILVVVALLTAAAVLITILVNRKA